MPELTPQLRVELPSESLELLEQFGREYGGTAEDVLEAMIDDPSELLAIMERPGWREYVQEHCRQQSAAREQFPWQRTFLVRLSEQGAAGLHEVARHLKCEGHQVADALLALACQRFSVHELRQEIERQKAEAAQPQWRDAPQD